MLALEVNIRDLVRYAGPDVVNTLEEEFVEKIKTSFIKGSVVLG